MATDTKVDVKQAADDLKDEHKHLRSMLDRLADAPDLATLRQALEEVHPKLHEHFAHEEYPGGFYDRMGACSGEFRNEVRALVDQHYRFLALIRDLSSRAKDAGEDEVAELQREAQDLVKLLHEHEVVEHELAAKAHKKTKAPEA